MCHCRDGAHTVNAHCVGLDMEILLCISALLWQLGIVAATLQSFKSAPVHEAQEAEAALNQDYC